MVLASTTFIVAFIYPLFSTLLLHISDTLSHLHVQGMPVISRKSGSSNILLNINRSYLIIMQEYGLMSMEAWAAVQFFLC